MKSAEPVIKEAASHITVSNDEDGAAYAIRLMMEGKVEQIRKAP